MVLSRPGPAPHARRRALLVLRRGGDAYRAEIERSDAVLQALDLSAALAWWPDYFGSWRLDDVRDLLLHVITETACHAAHLDAVRELLDGRQWIVLQ